MQKFNKKIPSRVFYFYLGSSDVILYVDQDFLKTRYFEFSEMLQCSPPKCDHPCRLDYSSKPCPSCSCQDESKNAFCFVLPFRKFKLEKQYNG